MNVMHPAPGLVRLSLMGLVACGFLVCGPTAKADKSLSVAPTAILVPPSADAVRTKAVQWLASQEGADPERRAEAARLWAFGDELRTSEELFDLVIRTLAAVDEPAKTLVEACRWDQPALAPPDPAALSKAGGDAFYTANLRLFFGRYLAQRELYEESLDVLAKVPLSDVSDPATLLFFTAVCQHQLLMKTEGLATVKQLLTNTDAVPLRYANLAQLIQYDLEALEDQSLDEASRMMTDVERRLNLGRAGQKVQKREDEIVAIFDELIKKLEAQGGGGGGAAGNSNQSNSPAGDSRVKGATAPGNVDKKTFKNDGAWGALPPKARAKAKDLIAREFPAHYRQAIEEYTKRQASRPASGR